MIFQGAVCLTAPFYSSFFIFFLTFKMKKAITIQKSDIGSILREEESSDAKSDGGSKDAFICMHLHNCRFRMPGADTKGISGSVWRCVFSDHDTDPGGTYRVSEHAG